MHYLMVAATAREINPFINYWQEADNEFDLDILISGIGLTASTYHLTRQLAMEKYDCVVQAGVAGCFDSSIPLGTVLAVKQDTIADQSILEMQSLKALFDLKRVPHNQHPYKKDWLINPHKTLLKKSRLKTVNGISVNEISTSRQKIRFYTEKFQPVTESMEGAALHYVCLMEKTPFLQIRSVSNYIGEKNRKKWNMEDSIANLNDVLIDFFEALNRS